MEELMDRMQVTVPRNGAGGIQIEKFQLNRDQAWKVPTRPGTYTALFDHGKRRLSDTDAERKKNLEPVHQVAQLKAESVVINGLGLGMVLQAVLSFDHVQHVDVIEHDPRIIKLVGSHYKKDKRVRIHYDDAYACAKKWRTGTRWDVGWTNIWDEVSQDNKKGMSILNRSYGRRCKWHSSQGYEDLVRQNNIERERNRERERKSVNG